MNINLSQDGSSLTVSLEGRLDTRTAPELDSAMKSNIDGVTSLTFDLEALDYISSAGLRVLLSCQKAMNRQGKMVVKNANSVVNDIFEVTGFSEILTIE